MRPSFFNHLHPPTIPALQARFRYTLGAGGLSVFLLLVVLTSGIPLMFYYVPTPPEAALSVQRLQFLVPFGGLLRGLHYWSAQLLVVVSLVHLLRVVFTGAYAPPRRFNYLLGLLLLVTCLFLDFSGYVLRWDEGVHWALVAGTNLVKTIPALGPGLYVMLMGGSLPGPATLIRFYTWHIFGLTIGLVILGVWHLFRVRRDGGIAIPPPAARRSPERISRGELSRREALAALLAGAGLIALAAFLPAPLAPPLQANPLALTTAALAPWFFLWVQELLKWGDPFLWGVLLPLLVFTLLVLLPYLLPNAQPDELGRWFPGHNRLARAIMAFVTLSLLLLTVLAIIS